MKIFSIGKKLNVERKGNETKMKLIISDEFIYQSHSWTSTNNKLQVNIVIIVKFVQKNYRNKIHVNIFQIYKSTRVDDLMFYD